MPLKTTQRLFIETFEGKILSLKPLSLGKRREFSKLIDSIFEMIKERSEDDPDLTFEEFYDADLLFASLCNEALICAGVDSLNLCMADLFSLLMPHIDDTGEVHQDGILVEFNYQNKIYKEGGKPVKSEKKTSWEEVIASLWKMQGSLTEAMDIVYDDRLPADEMLDVINSYIYLLTPPEERAKREGKDKALKAIKEMQQSRLVPQRTGQVI